MTVDPTVVIAARGMQFVVYQTVPPAKRERWIIRGVCSACGSCEVGAVNPDLIWTGQPVGTAGACLDRRFGERLDVPVRPEIGELSGCTLAGEYL